MFDDCYLEYYGKTRKLENEPKVVSEIELWIDDTNLLEAKIGTVFSEERKFEDFNGIQHAVIDLLREVDKEFIKLESEIRYYKRLARRKIKRVI